MICDGTPLGEDQKVGWCCCRKEIPKEFLEKNKVHFGDKEYDFPFCQVWRDEMRRRDREYPRNIQEMKKKNKR